MTGSELSPHYLISFKLADYEARHGGKMPARIFMSDAALLSVSKDSASNYLTMGEDGNKMFGIPVTVFPASGALVYLSDEEADFND